MKLKSSSYLLAILAGMAGSLVMFFLMRLGISKNIAPFNVTPSAAMVIKLGFSPKPLALIVHLLYGALGSVILIAIYKKASSLKSGLIIAFLMWLIFMVVYSPILGWGFFGFGNASSLASDSPLYLAPGPKFMLITLVLHIIYGIIIGLLDQWIVTEQIKEPQLT